MLRRAGSHVVTLSRTRLQRARAFTRQTIPLQRCEGSRNKGDGKLEERSMDEGIHNSSTREEPLAHVSTPNVVDEAFAVGHDEDFLTGPLEDFNEDIYEQHIQHSSNTDFDVDSNPTQPTAAPQAAPFSPITHPRGDSGSNPTVPHPAHEDRPTSNSLESVPSRQVPTLDDTPNQAASHHHTKQDNHSSLRPNTETPKSQETETEPKHTTNSEPIGSDSIPPHSGGPGRFLTSFALDEESLLLSCAPKARRYETRKITEAKLLQLKHIVGFIPEELRENHNRRVSVSHVSRYALGDGVTLLEPVGAQTHTFPLLDSMLGGFRPGELTVFTGPTGMGKTTLLTQISLGLAISGSKVLWGSFEVKTHHLVKKLVNQFIAIDLQRMPPFQHDGSEDVHSSTALVTPENSPITQAHSDRIERTPEESESIKRFQQLPLFLVDHQGPMEVETFVNTVAHDVVTHGAGIVIVDNLQFMLSNTFGTTRFDQQDRALTAFRLLADLLNVHVVVVGHPKKIPASDFLTMDSLFGGVKASQEADNVLMLQFNNGTKYLDVAKNRLLGRLGRMQIQFDPDTHCHVDEMSSGSRAFAPTLRNKLPHGRMKRNDSSYGHLSNWLSLLFKFKIPHAVDDTEQIGVDETDDSFGFDDNHLASPIGPLLDESPSDQLPPVDDDDNTSVFYQDSSSEN